MQIELTPEQSSFVALGIREGRFQSTEEAIQQALAQWEKRERSRAKLLASLEVAEQELDAGGGETYSAETLHTLNAAVKARGEARLSGR
ncbi:MAG TPA: hypothetical protein VE291_07410 [Terracidiphilus sp.]|jgi:Arc/MetJ-type ribon-helix-helix transcriptional regulator|nr:hypothetical protein [Terracidiphilus sp.]